MCKKQASSARKSFANALKMQRETRDAKKKATMEAKLENVKEQHMTAIYFHQQYFSPRCWQTVERALTEFEKLTTKKDRLKYVKDQILIRYLGLGWLEAHHP